VLGALQQILQGLGFAHSLDVFHQDIKPDNVFLAEAGTIKIADFGTSKVLASAEETVQRATAGTLNYMPPESFDGSGVSFGTDIWAVGCLIHEVITGEMTFPGTTRPEIKWRVLNSIPRKLPKSFSKALRRLNWCMLRKEESERPDALGILNSE